jgi:Tfp pilus assembly protein PilV
MTRSLKRGIQLVETLIAGTIFFVIAAVFLNLLPAAQWATKKSDNRLAALTIARSKTEVARQSPFADLDSTLPTTETTRVNGTQFEVTTSVAPVATANPDLLKELIVELQWNESKSRKDLVFRTYVSRVKP